MRRKKEMIPVRLNRKIEDFLLNRGIVLHPVRQLIRNQIYLSVLGTVIVLFSFSSPVFMGFFIGAVVGTLNFYVIAKLIQELVHVKKGATVPLLFSFYVRLGLTGLVLYFAIVYLQANVFSLLIGLSVVLLNVLIFGATLVSQKLKEA